VTNRNKLKINLTAQGNARLTMERRDSWGSVTERFQFTVPRRTLERALADATIEAPWKELLKR
jgi:hypothetical protein